MKHWEDGLGKLMMALILCEVPTNNNDIQQTNKIKKKQ